MHCASKADIANLEMRINEYTNAKVMWKFAITGEITSVRCTDPAPWLLALSGGQAIRLPVEELWLASWALSPGFLLIAVWREMNMAETPILRGTPKPIKDARGRR